MDAKQNWLENSHRWAPEFCRFHWRPAFHLSVVEGPANKNVKGVECSVIVIASFVNILLQHRDQKRVPHNMAAPLTEGY